MQKITSKDNPNIKLYIKLAGGKKYRKENGMFTLEGVRLVEDAVKENAELPPYGGGFFFVPARFTCAKMWYHISVTHHNLRHTGKGGTDHGL